MKEKGYIGWSYRKKVFYTTGRLSRGCQKGDTRSTERRKGFEREFTKSYIRKKKKGNQHDRGKRIPLTTLGPTCGDILDGKKGEGRFWCSD